MTETIPITVHQTATGYVCRAITAGVPAPTLHHGDGDSIGEALDYVVESIVNMGNGHNRLWIKSNSRNI